MSVNNRNLWIKLPCASLRSAKGDVSGVENEDRIGVEIDDELVASTPRGVAAGDLTVAGPQGGNSRSELLGEDEGSFVADGLMVVKASLFLTCCVAVVLTPNPVSCKHVHQPGAMEGLTNSIFIKV